MSELPDPGPTGPPTSVVRRAPFSDNPKVGPRGLRTQQRILDAARSVLAADGYHQCSIQRITEEAGCSRASFYQYFSGKEDVFRRLASQVVRRLDAATDEVGAVTADADGRRRLRTWIERYAEVYDDHVAVFHTFQSVAEDSARLADEMASTGRRQARALLERIATDDGSPAALDEIVDLLLHCVPRLLDDHSLLERAAPGAYPRDLVLDSVTDVAHRAVFGAVVGVNVPDRHSPAPPRLAFGPVMQSALADATGTPSVDGSTREALTTAAREVFMAQGFHGTRIDAIVDAAGVSHGTFYHYFENKNALAQELAAEAMRTVSTTLHDIPVLDGSAAARTALHGWLREYNRAQAGESAMYRMWVDAALQQDDYVTEAGALLEWGRRRMARFLRDSGAIGDVEIDAVVLLALLDGLGRNERPPETLDAALEIVERGFLGRV